MKYQMVPISPNQYHSHSILASSRRPQLVDCFLFVVFPIISCPGGHLGSCQTALQMSSAPSSIFIDLLSYHYANTFDFEKCSQNKSESLFLQKPSACLICVPPALMALTSIGILLPSTGKVGHQRIIIIISMHHHHYHHHNHIIAMSSLL